MISHSPLKLPYYNTHPKQKASFSFISANDLVLQLFQTRKGLKKQELMFWLRNNLQRYGYIKKRSHESLAAKYGVAVCTIKVWLAEFKCYGLISSQPYDRTKWRKKLTCVYFWGPSMLHAKFRQRFFYYLGYLRRFMKDMGAVNQELLALSALISGTAFLSPLDHGLNANQLPYNSNYNNNYEKEVTNIDRVTVERESLTVMPSLPRKNMLRIVKSGVRKEGPLSEAIDDALQIAGGNTVYKPRPKLVGQSLYEQQQRSLPFGGRLEHNVDFRNPIPVATVAQAELEDRYVRDLARTAELQSARRLDKTETMLDAIREKEHQISTESDYKFRDSLTRVLHGDNPLAAEFAALLLHPKE